MITPWALLVAFSGGLASFASPCVLPLVPIYLSVIGASAKPLSASPPSTTPTPTSSRFALRATTGFVLGFSAVFTLLGLAATSFAHAITIHQTLLIHLSGIFIVAMALFMIYSTLFPTIFTQREYHPSMNPRRFGFLAPVFYGVAFAFGWTPCVGPVLASILALAATSSHFADALVLLLAFSLGIAVPFLVVSFFLDRLARPLAWLKSHARLVTLTSAALLGILGVLLLFGRLALITTWVTSL